MPDRAVRWTVVAGASVAAFLGLLGFEVGRASVGDDPAIRARATPAATPSDAAPEPFVPQQTEQAPELPPLTTQQS
jgi:hypothetical protein